MVKPRFPLYGTGLIFHKRLLAGLVSDSIHTYLLLLAGQEGFEPPRRLRGLAVFKTAPFNHLGTTPYFAKTATMTANAQMQVSLDTMYHLFISSFPFLLLL